MGKDWNKEVNRSCRIETGHLGYISFKLLKSVKIWLKENYQIIWLIFRANFRNIKQKLLQEIAIELEVSSQEITSKFHALRTQFNRESNKEKQQKSGSASADNYVSKWEYMASLKFLKSTNTPGTTFSNLVLSPFVLIN